jgi:hypothetical protein
MVAMARSTFLVSTITGGDQEMEAGLLSDRRLGSAKRDRCGGFMFIVMITGMNS